MHVAYLSQKAPLPFDLHRDPSSCSMHGLSGVLLLSQAPSRSLRRESRELPVSSLYFPATGIVTPCPKRPEEHVPKEIIYRVPKRQNTDVS